MPKDIFPRATPEITARRRLFRPDIREGLTSLSVRVFAAGTLPAKVKQLIARAAAHMTHSACVLLHNDAVVLRDPLSDQQLRRRASKADHLLWQRRA